MQPASATDPAPAKGHAAAAEPAELAPPVHPSAGEKRGARKLARAAATASRRVAHERAAAALQLPPATAAEAAARWDLFYATKSRLYKDRHLLRAALPDLVSAAWRAHPERHAAPLARAPTGAAAAATRRDARCNVTLVEAGCGAGHAVFPLLRANAHVFAFAFDYSAGAVAAVREHAEFRADRVAVFQADVTEAASYVGVVRAGTAGAGADFVTAVWTLSALAGAQAVRKAVQGLAQVVREGGVVFVRDYASGDMREGKFERAGRGVGERLYLRGDGTYAYFFEEGEMRGMFEEAGMVVEECACVDRVVQNRKEGLVMRRRWIQGRFRKKRAIDGESSCEGRRVMMSEEEVLGAQADSSQGFGTKVDEMIG